MYSNEPMDVLQDMKNIMQDTLKQEKDREMQWHIKSHLEQINQEIGKRLQLVLDFENKTDRLTYGHEDL